MQLQPKRMKVDDEVVVVMEGEDHEEENSGGGHHLSPLSSSPLPPSGHDYLQEAASMGVSGADVPAAAAAAALAPTASISTTPPATTSVLLSMMHSMPFLVFGPQLAAAAAALAASNHHHHHHQMNRPESAQQTNHPHNRAPKRCSPNSSSSTTDFSIDSILNDRGSSSSTRSSVQLAPKVPGTSSISAQFSAWSMASLGNGSYEVPPAPPVQPYHQHHHHLCDPSSPFPWLSSQQQLHNSHYFQYNTSSSSSSPYKVNHSPTTTTTTTAETDHTSKCSPKSTDSNCSSTSSAGPKSGTPSSKQQRKTLNRGPRIPFTSAQVAELEAKFAATQYLSSMEVSTLAKRLSLTDNRIRIWFQNRRAREKREHRPLPSMTAANKTSGESGDQLNEENSLQMMTTKNSIESTEYNNADLGGLQEELEDSEGEDHREHDLSMARDKNLD